MAESHTNDCSPQNFHFLLHFLTALSLRPKTNRIFNIIMNIFLSKQGYYKIICQICQYLKICKCKITLTRRTLWFN